MHKSSWKQMRMDFISMDTSGYGPERLDCGFAIRPKDWKNDAILESQMPKCSQPPDRTV